MISRTPQLHSKNISEVVLDLYGLEVSIGSIKELNSYYDRNYYFSVTNANNLTEYEDGYLLKITNSVHSQDKTLLEGENKIMKHCNERGVLCSRPISTKKGSYVEYPNYLFDDGKKYGIRVLTFIRGTILYDVEEWTPDILKSWGKSVGHMTQVLKEINFSLCKESDSLWALSSVPKLLEYVYILTPDQRIMALEIIEKFTETMSNRSDLECGLLHGDLNEQNILICNSRIGIIDFGDYNFNPLIFELAIAMMYAMTKNGSIHPNEVGGWLIAGYIEERLITKSEFRILKMLVASRYVQSLTLGEYSRSKDPDNEYLSTTIKNGWRILEEFWNDKNIESKWESVYLT